MEINNLKECIVEDVLKEVFCYKYFWGKDGGIIVLGGEVML